jgi:hypothetical protein
MVSKHEGRNAKIYHLYAGRKKCQQWIERYMQVALIVEPSEYNIGITTNYVNSYEKKLFV